MASASDITGKAMTVRGPVGPDELGMSLMHEHLFLDVRKNHLPPPDVTSTELAVWEAKLDLSNLHLARDGEPLQDNYLLTDEEMAVKEVSEFQKFGGGTVVDVTSIGLKRDPLALRRVSDSTGLNVIMGSSWYQKLFHPDDMDQRTVEDLTDEIIRDVNVGVGDTGIRSGIIGEVGINGDPLTANEIKLARASAGASRATGAAISIHFGGAGREKFEVASTIAEEGGDLERTILGHADTIAGDLPLLLELLELGLNIEFDTLGYVWSRGSSFRIPQGQAIPKLIEAGYVQRILLSHDVCHKTHLKSYGGRGYSFIPETFVPHLRSLGVSQEHIDQMLVQNPKRLLTFVAPQ